LIDSQRINTGCEGFTTYALLKASCTLMSDVTLKRIFIDTQMHHRACCEDLCLRFNISKLFECLEKYRRKNRI
jgi:hypothetical protein